MDRVRARRTASLRRILLTPTALSVAGTASVVASVAVAVVVAG